ncbi:MAG: MFS transporter, partial [Oscillospiraceae bacterium]
MKELKELKEINPKYPILMGCLPLTAMTVLIPMATTKLGVTAIGTTALFSVFSLALLVFRFFIGKGADRIGWAPLFMISFFVYSTSYSLFILTPRSMVYMYLAQIVRGLATVLLSISTLSMISEMESGKRTSQLGLINSYKEKSGLIGVLICFILLSNCDFSLGWSILFKAATIGSTLAALYMIKKIPPLGGNVCKTSKIYDAKIFEKNKFLLIVNLFIGMGISMVSAVFVLYIADKFNPPLAQIGAAFFVPAIIVAFASPYLGKFSDKLGPIFACVAGTVIASMSLLFLTHTKNLLSFAVIWTIYALGAALIYISLTAVFMENNQEARGEALGIFTSFG